MIMIIHDAMVPNDDGDAVAIAPLTVKVLQLTLHLQLTVTVISQRQIHCDNDREPFFVVVLLVVVFQFQLQLFLLPSSALLVLLLSFLPCLENDSLSRCSYDHTCSHHLPALGREASRVLAHDSTAALTVVS
jgi:hypothetical protein